MTRVEELLWQIIVLGRGELREVKILNWQGVGLSMRSHNQNNPFENAIKFWKIKQHKKQLLEALLM